ncbi:MAG: PAS domain S-box protein [Spirochaetes bacterium]|nr:PAS domain S-box protein [Spirochaetota bacterium]
MKKKKAKQEQRASVKTNKQKKISEKNIKKTTKPGHVLPKKTVSGSTNINISSILDQAPEMIMITDPEGKIEYVNDCCEKITGYKKSEIIGNNPLQIKNLNHFPSFSKDISKTIKNRGYWKGILVNKKKNGTLYNEEATIFSIKNINGEIIKYAGIIRDVSERKKEEEDILKQNRLLNNMIEAFTYPVYVIDAEKGYIVVSNSAAKSQNIKEGLHYSQINYGSKFRISSGSSMESPMEIIIRTKEPVYMDYSTIDENGTSIYRELYGYPIFNSQGNVTQIIEYVMDITDRKRSQEELVKLSQAVEQSLNIVMITNKEGIIEYVNPKFTEITGYEFREVVGNKASSLGKLAQEEKNLFWKTLHSEGEWRGEFHNRKKNGDSYWEYASIYAIKNSQDVVTHYIKDAVNISKRKQAEEELKAAKEKAELANRFKSEFLANMSHEIRTPLNSILGFIELLLTTELNRQQKDYFDTIKDSSKVLLGIIDDILDFSKIKSGKLEIDNIKFYLKYELEPVVDMFVARADEKKIELLYFIDPSLPEYVFGDPLRIKQVLNNLISNAIKFTPEGGKIQVEIKLENLAENCRILFSVTDNGIGISKGKQQKIFSAFFQADSSISRKYGGTGLGLAISSYLVEAMGSKLKIESNEGEGSKFYFELVFREFSSADIFKRDYNFNNLKCFLFLRNNSEKIQLNNIKRYLKAFNIHTETFSSIEELYKLNFTTKNIIFLYYYSNVQNEIKKIQELIPEISTILIANRLDHEFIQQIISKTTKAIYKPVYASKILGAIIEIIYDEKQQIPRYIRDKQKQRINFNASALVAEDNPVNQKLIALMLKEIGINADIAANGLDAIEKFNEKKYDIIFMDINMPVMDGLEATVKILDIEKLKNLKHTPIIALTAKSVMGDREVILESGMDDYLTKPISISKLYGSISPYFLNLKDLTPGNRRVALRETPFTENFQSTNNTKPVSEKKYTGGYDLEGTADELGVNIEFLSNLISQFMTNFENYFASILKSVRDLEFDSIYAEAHKLKGTASNLRLNKLAEFFSEMEINAKNKNKFDYNETLNLIRKEFNSLKSEFFQQLGE